MGCAVRFIIVLLCHSYAYAYCAANHISWRINVILVYQYPLKTQISSFFCSSTVPYSQPNVVKTLLVAYVYCVVWAVFVTLFFYIYSCYVEAEQSVIINMAQHLSYQSFRYSHRISHSITVIASVIQPQISPLSPRHCHRISQSATGIASVIPPQSSHQSFHHSHRISHFSADMASVTSTQQMNCRLYVARKAFSLDKCLKKIIFRILRFIAVLILFTLQNLICKY